MSMNLEDTPMFKYLESKFKIMCMNWHYLHYPEKHKHLSLDEYVNLNKSLYQKLVENALFSEMVLSGIKVKHLQSSEAFHTIFDDIQQRVFKIMDMMDKKETIDKDFKND